MTDLQAAIEAGDVDRCLALPLGWTDAQRRAEAKPTVDAFRAIRKQYWARLSEMLSGRRDERLARQYEAGSLALLAVASYSDITDLFKNIWSEHVYAILAARRPDWLREWCAWALRDNDRYWPAVRRFVREGLCDRPETEMYYLWMAQHAVQARSVVRPESRRSVREFLLEDPDLLEHDVWELFRIEGNKLVSLTSIDKYWGGFGAGLIELAADGKLDRSRLLDASLEALTFDFPQYRAGWFSRFHDDLKPTIDERAQRVDTYTGLLASRVPPTVSFALTAVATLDRAGRVSPSTGIDSIGPALQSDQKAVALTGLKLVSGWVAADPSLTSRAADALRPAVDHGAREVREAAQAALSRFGAAQPRLRADQPIPGSSVATQIAHDSPAPSGPSPITPITTLEDLVMAFSAVLENEGPPDELERVLDGVSRFCAERPPGFERLTGPLRKRALVYARNLGTSWEAHYVRGIFTTLACAWLTKEIPAIPAVRGRITAWRKIEGAADFAYALGVTQSSVAQGGTVDAMRASIKLNICSFLSARVAEVVQRVGLGRGEALLAAPTHAGGWLEPSVFVDRLVRQPNPGRVDLIQSLLRLRPDGRSEALAAAQSVSGAVGDVVRYALGADAAPVSGDPPLWAAAAGARAYSPADAGPLGMVWEKREHEVDGKTYRNYFVLFDLDRALPDRWTADAPTLMLFNTPPLELALVRWAATVWPVNRQSWYAAGARLIGDNRDWWEAQWGNKGYLETLLADPNPIRGTASWLLAAALTAKDPAEGTLATDTVIAAVVDGRLNRLDFGQVLLLLLSWEGIVASRVTKRLLDAARVSGAHAEAVLDALSDTLISTPADLAGMGDMLDLLLELTLLTERQGVPDALRDRLAALKGGTKAAVAAKRLLALRVN